MAIEILSNIVALKFKYLFVSYLPPGRPIRSWEFCDVHFNFDPTLQFVLIAPEWDTRLSVRHRFSTFCSHLICFTQNSGHQQGVDRSTKFYFHGRVSMFFTHLKTCERNKAADTKLSGKCGRSSATRKTLLRWILKFIVPGIWKLDSARRLWLFKQRMATKLFFIFLFFLFFLLINFWRILNFRACFQFRQLYKR